MTSSNDLIATQQQLTSAIENVLTNFKKDGSDRKTTDYIKRRLDTLDSYWFEYDRTYIQLMQLELDLSSKERVDQEYERVKDRFDKIRAHIQGYQPKTEERPRTPVLKPPTFVAKPGESSSTPQTSRSTASKTEEMLKKQQSNFRAFHRTISGIVLESVSERWELEDLLHTVQSRWRAIDSLHWDLDAELDGSNRDYEKAFSNYENRYSELKKAISKKIWSVTHVGQSTPKMDIPTFNGNYNSWVSFKDLFYETIHNNPSMSGAQKMQYLKSKVKGEAEKLIQHLPVSSDNYTTCWDILNNRYNNKKLIFTSHMNTLTNIPVMQQKSVAFIKRMHDTALECLNAIKNLGIDVSTWDPILVYLLTQKLDSETYTDYVESVADPKELPILKELLDFLELKFTTLETSRRKQDNLTQKQPIKYQNNNQRPNFYKNAFSTNSKIISQPTSIGNRQFLSAKYHCSLCNSFEHGIYFCKQFLEMPSANRLMTVKRLNLCPNCLFNHHDKQCTSEKVCRECNQAHNSLLHEAYKPRLAIECPGPSGAGAARGSTRGGSASETNTSAGKSSKSSSHVSLQNSVYEVLLPTAIINVQAADGTSIKMRALLDQGSQISLISENAAQLLKLPRQKCLGVVSGIGAKESNSKGMLTISCSSRVCNYTFQTDVLIMKHLIKNIPNQIIAKPDWSYLEHIKLADPEFYQSGPVDLLLGADIYSSILLDGICRADSNLPTAQQTRLGWILSGNVKTFHCNVVLQDMEEIHRFWEIEEISEQSELSVEDQQCMDYYQATTTRREDGRYQVRLPMKQNYQEKIGHSKSKSVAQFYKLEQKLARQPDIALKYKSFIDEYIALGHMTPSPTFHNLNIKCYLPHHCVIREDSTTTKLRVVFNASDKTSTGMSLNDVMSRGPNLQQDLQSLIIKWRQHKYVVTADIEKMFRQIWVHPDDQKLQMIVWRDNKQEILQDYQLATVTYGTKAAPFLAMMTLKQLARDENMNYQGSSAPRVLEDTFYMDDWVHGSHSISTAKKLQSDMIQLLRAGGFHLRKWKSNAPELLEGVEADQDNFDFKQPESTKALGLGWNPQNDVFTFQSKIISECNQPTKRVILSEISKLFDPLGWLAPVNTKLKILFQDVWRANVQWDEPVPQNLCDEWIQITTNIVLINSCEVPRWLQTLEKDHVELHGFCDASTKAYAGVVYCKINRKNSTTVTLVAGKTKIVPLSKNITLPRLELCGAVLLFKLMAKIKECLSNHEISVYGWTDSMAVLGWLNGQSDRWKPFVANRVKQVIEVMPATCWRYVKSKDNPADCASRGLSASQLKEHTLWWRGPTWLPTFSPEKEKIQNYSTNEEAKKVKQVNVTQLSSESEMIKQLLERQSSLNKAVRVLAWVLRFSSKEEKKDYLTVEEIRKCNLIIIKSIQKEIYRKEISNLIEGKQVSSKSKICSLNPKLDENGILRVGGRLKHANMNPEAKHPIIIPGSTRLADLIIDQAHKLSYHGGARITTAYIRQRYWVVGGNNATKKRLRLCVKCKRHNPTFQPQIMGDLPSARINPSRPFYHCGVDYTGHFTIKANKGRGIKTTKGYVAVFVCMSTKAIHLELVSDLTSSAFLAALRRMAARRGLPGHMYSDQGTNFIGANKVLKQELTHLKEMFDQELMTEIASMGIEWHFNAPSWPSAGGLWEAAVKSLKRHLIRGIGQQNLTFEEFTTLLSQLEGCLNSRPLCPITEDPDDLDFLTPSHFLASGPILTLYETERDLRTRWQLTQKIFTDIWSRWRDEYLTQLSTRSKWTKPHTNIKLEDVVIIKDENLPPGKWVMGRVVQLHPGSDGFVRVVTLKTKTGLLKRPVVKLSILPINQENNQTGTRDSCPKKPLPCGKKGSFFTTIAMSLLLFLFFTTPISCSYTMTSLPSNNSLYFDRITNINLIRDDWRLIVYYDTQPYQEGNTALSKYIKYLEGLCLRIPIQSYCDGIILQLRHESNELQHYNDILMSHHNINESKGRRTRRGLINGVGYIANSLFGVLDEHFAEKYERDISLVRENQKHLAALWKNQTSVVEAEFNLLKRMENIIDQHHKQINKKFNNMEKTFNQIRNELENIHLVHEFIATAMVTSNILNDLKNIQQTLIDTITNIYNGKFNFHLLTPDQLRQELNVIAGQLPKDLSIPVDNYEDLSEIYNLLHVRAATTNNYIIFEIKIPLISGDLYEVLRIIPVPYLTRSKEERVVLPISEHVAVNLKKDAFLPLTEQDLKSCVQRNPKIMLCHIKKPIYHIKDDQNFCECLLNSRQCKTITNQCKNRWEELNKMNSYFYFCCEQCQLKVLCGDQISSVQLTHSGFFNIDQGCIIKSADFFVYSHRQETNNITISSNIQPPEISQINHLVNISFTNDPLTSNQSDIQEHMIQLQEIKEKLNVMTKSQPLAEGMSYHDVHHYAAIYILAAVIGVVCLVWAWRRFRRAPAPPVPAPRDAATRTQCRTVSVQCIPPSVQYSKKSEVPSTSARVLKQNNSTSPVVLRSVYNISDSDNES